MTIGRHHLSVNNNNYQSSFSGPWGNNLVEDGGPIIFNNQIQSQKGRAMWLQNNHRRFWSEGAGGGVWRATTAPTTSLRSNIDQPPKKHIPLFFVSHNYFPFKLSTIRITLTLFVPRGLFKFISRQNKQHIIIPNLIRRNFTKISLSKFKN